MSILYYVLCFHPGYGVFGFTIMTIAFSGMATGWVKLATTDRMHTKEAEVLAILCLLQFALTHLATALILNSRPHLMN